MKNRNALAVFPLLLSLLASGISPPAVFPFLSEFLDMSIPEMSRDYLPFTAPSMLVASKPKLQVPLWRSRLLSQSLYRTYQHESLFSSPETVPLSVISEAALGTVLRC
jgi:hypothetical protein